ncbi:hypothetical protein NQ315_003710 [Exocentrus adspersus]|uniref:Uncharacterized protein n=1 Tax=Exocentrus adspersus TaxID=1586481 RepID=A0AAV8V5Z7_9CUCU|nr:hypothetical protein NQ315_003710 [Exocentrus adspersus]
MYGWGDRRRTYDEVVKLFNETFRVGVTGISKSTGSKTIKKFDDTGTNKNRPKPGRPKTETSEEHQMEVAQSFVENPHLNLRKTSQELQINRVILKIIKFHPYKIHLHHEINEDDPDRRLEFCENMMERIAQNHNYSSFIVFSDESTFQLNGEFDLGLTLEVKANNIVKVILERIDCNKYHTKTVNGLGEDDDMNNNSNVEV